MDAAEWQPDQFARHLCIVVEFGVPGFATVSTHIHAWHGAAKHLFFLFTAVVFISISGLAGLLTPATDAARLRALF